jgi:hypothetical protein
VRSTECRRKTPTATLVSSAAIAAALLTPCSLWPAPLQSTGSTMAAAPAVKAITVSFKLDPRLSGGTYGGELWTSPPSFTSATQSGSEGIVEAKVQGVTPLGRTVAVAADWAVADPSSVTVAPAPGNKPGQVRITARRGAGSKVTISAHGLSKEILVTARPVGDGSATQVQITQ